MVKSRKIEKENFIELLKEAVLPLYHIALNQEFEI